MDEVISLWQPVGYSTHLIAKRVSEKLNTKVSHTGTLDPMAEGVVIILAGETRKKKYEFAKWLKEYEFEMVFGVSTDTLDGLGIPKISNAVFEEDTLKEITKDLIGDYKQKYPVFSAKKVLGKPLHWFARKDKLDTIQIPHKEGVIHDLQLLSINELSFLEISNNVISRVSKITGDLRQEEIKDAWVSLKVSSLFKVAKFKVVLTKGLYVRGLVRDIAHRLNVEAFTYSIKRTKNGEFTRNNSKTLEDFFGSGFDKNNFVSRSKS